MFNIDLKSEYPDISQYPDIVYLNSEHVLPEILSVIQSNNRLDNTRFLYGLFQDTVICVGVNSNYIDNLFSLLDDYILEVEIDVYDKLSSLIMGLAHLIYNHFKLYNLYAIDDTSYYLLNEIHTYNVFSIKKVEPIMYHEYVNNYIYKNINVDR